MKPIWIAEIALKLILIAVIGIAAGLAGGCGSNSENQRVEQAHSEDSPELHQVDTPVTDYSPASLRASKDGIVIRTLKPKNGSNVWSIDDDSLETTLIRAVGQLSEVFYANGSVWGLADEFDANPEVVTLDSMGVLSRVSLGRIGCKVQNGWVLSGKFWIRCGSRLVAISGKVPAITDTVTVEPRSLILPAAGTLWEFRSGHITAVAGRKAGHIITIPDSQDGPWDTDGAEAWAISVDDAGMPLLKRIDFAREQIEEFPVETDGLTPYEIVVTPTEIWLSTVESPTILRYSRTTPERPIGRIDVATTASSDFDLGVAADNRRAWIMLRLESEFSLFRVDL